MNLTIALAGNPNSGKSTLFNELTGARQTVGNWPGVTVEKKVGTLRGFSNIQIIDLPGTYSLDSSSLEEIIAVRALRETPPDLILNVVDGTNLQRSLYLSLQLRELDTPMIVAVNMQDEVYRDGGQIDHQKLGDLLQCPVTGISALRNYGVPELIALCISSLQRKKVQPSPLRYSSPVEAALTELESAMPGASRFDRVHLLSSENANAEQELSDRARGIRLKTEAKTGEDLLATMVNDRYAQIGSIYDKVYSQTRNIGRNRTEAIDRIVLNRWLAFPVFALVMLGVYFLSINTIGGLGADWVNERLFGEIVPNALTQLFQAMQVSPWLQSLVIEGIVAGVGAVLGFLPQIAVLFVLLTLLESSGYMARIGFILDRLFRGFGLSGKSALPLLIATGCSVPAVMSTRSIENQSERRLMILVTGFIPCSAKLPVIALIAGTLFGGVWWVAPSAYFAGITAVLISGILLKRSGLFDFDGTPFIFEMPPYRMSTWRDVSLTVWQRVKGFVMKAGTVIFLSSMGLWLLLNYGFVAGKFVEVENIEQSFLASIGGLFAWIFTPLGWGNWQSVVASVTGLLAKENLVSSFAILYGVNEQAGAGSWSVLQTIYTPLAAYSLLIFNLLCVPCMATVAAIRREMNNARWTTFSLMYQTVYAYTVSFLIFQLGSWAEAGSFTGWTAAAVVLIVILVYMLTTRRKRKPRAESVPLASPVKEAR